MVLFLLDVDGTLLQESRAHVSAFRRVFSSLNISLRGMQFHGMTDRGILAEGFRVAGVQRDLDRELGRLVEYFLEEFTEEDVVPIEGSAEGIRGFSSLGEVGFATGNCRVIAQTRLSKVWKGQVKGGFGDMFTDRRDLVRYASRQFPGHDEVVVVGDTVRDIEAGRANGFLTVAVATGPYSPSELRDADLVLRNLGEWRKVLEIL